MSLVGTAVTKLRAIALKLDLGTIQNGIFGLNGLLIGATMEFLGLFGNGVWNPIWIIAVIVLSALATIVLKMVGTWFATYYNTQKFYQR